MGVIDRVPGTAAWVLVAVLGCASAAVAPAQAAGQGTGQSRVAGSSRTAVAPAAQTKKPTLRKKARSASKARTAGKRSPSRAQRRGKPALSTRGQPTRKAPPVATAGRTARPTVPPPVAWTPPPLGPERFYPNGIPELRPEFLHPLPGASADAPAVSARAAVPRASGTEPEWLP